MSICNCGQIMYFLIVLLMHYINCHKICYDDDSLVASDDILVPIFVESKHDDSVTLQCRPCSNIHEHSKKYWFKKTIFNIDAQKIKKKHSHTTINNKRELTIITKEVKDSGYYYCQGEDTTKINNNGFLFFVDVVKNHKHVTKTADEWIDHSKNLVRINNKFQATGDNFEVYNKWEEWSPCPDLLVNTTHMKQGHCRIRLKTNYEDMTDSNPYKKMQLFFKPYRLLLSCHSLVLKHHLEDISKIVRHIPDFNLIENCSSLSDHNTIFMNQFTLFEHESIEIGCLGATLNSNVAWHRNHEVIISTKKKHKHSSKHHMDIYKTLHLEDVSLHDQGVYQCVVDGKTTQHTTLMVLSQEKITLVNLITHIAYLSFILAMTLVCFCCGLFISWKKLEATR